MWKEIKKEILGEEEEEEEVRKGGEGGSGCLVEWRGGWVCWWGEGDGWGWGVD
jgi:hypothetical protein